jgi:hypothetical protein
MKWLLVVFLLIVLSAESYSQVEFEWSLTLQEEHHISNLISTSDGGFCAVGYYRYEYFDNYFYEYLIVDFEADGSIQWHLDSRVGGDDANLKDVIENYDGIYVAAGAINDYPSDYAALIMEFSTSGDVLSTYQYGNETSYGYNSISQAPDSSYWLTGYLNQQPPFLHHRDRDFNLLQSIEFPEVQSIWASNMIGNDLIAVGTVAGERNSGWIVRIDPTGSVLWENFVGSETYSQSFYDLAILENDGGIVAIGNAGANNTGNALIQNYTPEGELIWDRKINPNPFVYSASGKQIAVQPGPDGGFYSTIRTWQDSDPVDIFTGWLFKLDSQGEITWGLQVPDFYDLTGLTMRGVDQLAIGGRIQSPDGIYQHALANFVDFTGYTVLLYPEGLSVQIPPEGDTFTYHCTVTNSGEPSTKDIWVGIVHLPTLTPVVPRVWHNIPFDAEQSYTRIMSQTIPAGAPPGEYELTVHVGEYPWDSQDRSSFRFRKIGAATTFDSTIFQQLDRWPTAWQTETATLK